MPLGSITLPVTHLPSASSFYLSILQPFNYYYVEEREGLVGLGANGVADFFLVQCLGGSSPSTTSVTFDAPSAAAIDSFTSAAVRAGGSIRSYPILKDCETGLYAASVIDLEGNKISASCEDPRMSTYSASPTYYSPSIQRSNTDPSGAASVSGNGDGSFRVRVTTTTTTPPTSEGGGNGGGVGDGATTLMGTLLGVAAGAAIGYVVGKDKQDAAPAIARAVEAAPAAFRAIESFSGARSVAAPPQYGYPPMPRASTYHGSVASVPYAIEAPPSPPSEYGLHPAISEAGSRAISSRESRNGPLMIEPPPSHYSSARSGSIVSGRQTLPPSPPSAVTAKSHQSSRHSSSSSSSHRRDSPPAPSTVSKSSSASSSRTVRPEDYQLPASAAPSRVSAASAARSAAVSQAASKVSSHSPSKASSKARSSSSKQAHDVPLPASRATSTASSRKAHEYELPASRATSTTSSRQPHDYALPTSRGTSVATSRQPHEYSLPSSKATSVASASTIKPPRSALGLKKNEVSSDDEGSLAPSDSISQVSSKRHKKKVHRHRKRGSSDAGEKKRSTFSLPIRSSSIRSNKESRDVVSQA